MQGGGTEMAAKRALVVDDSKSARAFLSKMLEKYELEVVSVESAEHAIEYLAHHRPDVIFMDHLMPGMDGFQAVQTIKNNPRTATIPIMMYTSQEGELYLGQARALGAVGVLPKQIKPADVSKVLYQLHLLPERRTSEQSTFRPLGGGVEIDDGESTAPVARPLTEVAMREQMADLRRMLLATLDTHAERLRADLDGRLEEATAALLDEGPLRRRTRWAGIAAAVAAVIAIASLVIAGLQAARTRALAAEVAELRAALGALRPDEPAAASHAARGVASHAPVTLASADLGATQTVQALPGGGAALAGEASTARAGAGGATAHKGRPGGPIVEVVPFGEDPLGGPRLDALRQLFDRLVADGYRGMVEVKVFPGRFCLMGNSTDGFSLAPDETAFAKCDVVGSPALPDDASAPQRIPLAFADLASELRSASHGSADVQVQAGDEKSTLVAYPPISDALTAGEWNRAGSANNRIEIRVR
jgi:CheY-like chemotaxis protein